MRNLYRLGFTVWVLLAGVLGSFQAGAVAPEIRDSAGLFSRGALASANETLQRLQRDFRKDLLLETFPGVPATHATAYASNREEFFASYVRERAQAARLDGIYVLVMKEAPPHRLRVQVGVGQATKQKAFLAANRDELVRVLQTSFREDNYDQGLSEAVAYVERTLRKNLPGGVTSGGLGAPSPSLKATERARGETTPRSVPPATSNHPAYGTYFTYGLLALGGLLLVGFVFRLLRGGFGGGAPVGNGLGGGGLGGGGFLTSLFGGIGGMIAGSWIYDQFFNSAAHASEPQPLDAGNSSPNDVGGDYNSSGGDVDLDAEADDFGGGGGDYGDSGGGGDV